MISRLTDSRPTCLLSESIRPSARAATREDLDMDLAPVAKGISADADLLVRSCRDRFPSFPLVYVFSELRVRG
jgi:hypothetical protein